MAKISRNTFITIKLFFIVFLVILQAISNSAYNGIKTRAYQRDPTNDQAFQQQQFQQNEHIASSGSSSSRTNYQSTPQRLSDYHTNNQNNNNYNQDHNQHRQTNYDTQQQQQEPLYQRSYQGGQAQPLRTAGTTWSDAENSITEYFTGCPTDHTGQLPYAYDCRRFLNCWRGRGHIQTCAPGTVFNPETLECDRPDKVLCGVNGGLAARLPSQDPPLAPLRKEPQTQSAPQYRAGRLTDTTNQNTPNLCPPNVSGLQPHPSDCTKFVNCANGNMHIQQCGPGTAFSVTMQVCDFKHKVNCGQRPLNQPETNTAVNSQRESKSYESLSQQEQSHNRKNDRWSNMNMQRPNPIAYNHQNQQLPQQAVDPTWSGTSTSIDNQSPNGNVLYEEGSLRPGHIYGNNRKIYSAQLAPFSPTTSVNTTTRQIPTSTPSTNLYFAQPLGSQEDSKEAFSNNNARPHYRPDSSRNLPFSSNTNRWIPITQKTTTDNNRPYQTKPLSTPSFQGAIDAVNIPNRHLMPPLSTDVGQRPLTDTQLPTNLHDYNGQFDNNRRHDKRPTNTNHINVPNTRLMPPLPNDNGQRPLTDTDTQNFNYDDDDVDQFDDQRNDQLPSNSDNTYTIDETKLFGGPKPSKNFFQSTPNYYDTTPKPFTKFETTTINNRRYNNYPDIQSNVPMTPFRPISSYDHHHRIPTPTPPEPIATPITYLQPPIPATTPLNSHYSPPMPSHIFNATKQTFDRDPHYSPSYSAVVHSNTGIKNSQIPQTDIGYNNFLISTTPRTHTSSHNPYSLLSTTEKRGSSPPPYNRDYYNPNRETNDENEPDIGQLPLSDALRMLLKPYTNRNMSEEAAAQAESNIMNIFAMATTTTTTLTTDPKVTQDAYNPIATISTTPSTTTTFRTNSIPLSAHKKLNTSDNILTSDMDDVELILAGEQHSLSTKPTENTHILKTDFHLNTPITPKQPNESNNWQNQHYHSRDYHARNPNLPNPFKEDERSSSNSSTTNWHQHKHIMNHHHYSHHNHGQNHHSRDFHSRHPNLPNPFVPKTREGDNSFVDTDMLDIPNPNAEATTVSYDIRGSFAHDICEYDCGNGKCIKTVEVCDGVNNCGNRKDESRCDHLGYKVRLTGADTPNAGRIEVKIRDKWGYVCDDKFGLRDADVVCKELGFEHGASEVRGSSFYPPLEENFSYIMDEVDCIGNETSLKDCDFKGWGINNCGHDEVAGVVCKVPLLKCPNDYWLCSTSKECIPPAFVCDNTPDCADKSDESDAICNSPVEYRLEGGRNAIEGRLEVKYRGVWGTVCDDDFSIKEAQVACNSLGYYGKPEIKKNIFGPGNGPIWLDQVSCYGHEESIDKCNHWTWGEHNCNHTEDVGLHCTAGPPPRKSTKTPTYPSISDEEFHALDGQTTLEDIGIYSNSWARSSKALNNVKRCGHYKNDLIDEYEHPEERVINGTVAKRGRYPWQATIRTKGRAGISSHWCGAVLISKKHLLTAAHCLAGYPKGAYFIRLGDHYANIAESSEIDSYIENWYLHEKFRDRTHMNNDIALIVLKTPVKFNDYIQPICLPEKGAQLKTGRMCTISGWGSIKSGVSTPSNILRAAQLPILSDDTCKQRQVYGNSITDGMFCAGSMDESVDACDGDSGGPLVCEDDGAEILHGIISWGQHCGYANKPGVYVRVEKYIDWIYEKINFSLQQNDHK